MNPAKVTYTPKKNIIMKVPQRFFSSIILTAKFPKKTVARAKTAIEHAITSQRYKFSWLSVC
jgi:hypothetical protein